MSRKLRPSDVVELLPTGEEIIERARWEAFEFTLLEAVSIKLHMKTDGGIAVEESESDRSGERPDDCDCTPLMRDLPRWLCYRDGFEEPNPYADGTTPEKTLMS